MKKLKPWILTIALLFIVVAILLLTIWKPIWGIVSLLLLLFTVFTGSVLNAYFTETSPTQNASDNVILLSKKQLEKSQSLLRYATAILSFLSLITTANGMKSFVFNSDWMAYLGSFSIQSILVVLSLLLCRFYVQINNLSWLKYIKKLVNGLLTIFFCMGLIVSSTFSFSYIANNAYSDSSTSDSEIIIQTYLLEESYQLRIENEKRGKEIINHINSTGTDSLNSILNIDNPTKAKTFQIELQQELTYLNYSNQDENAVDIDKSEWDLAYSSYGSESETLYTTYNDSYRKSYQEAAQTYNQTIALINTWSSSIDSIPEYDEVLKKCDQQIQSLENASKNLSSQIDEIANWRTSHLVNDIAPYRSAYNSASKTLSNNLNSLCTAIENLKLSINNMDSIILKNTSDEIDNIRTQIFLLGVDENIDVQDILAIINDLAIDSAQDDTYSSEEIKSIITLRDDLLLYEEYITLKNSLDTYIQHNIKKTYYIIPTSKNNTNCTNTQTDNATDNTKEGTVTQNQITITEENWKTIRNEDFNQLYTYIKSLPDISSILTDYTSAYDDTSLILDKATTIQRDLLGQLTDFERAFTYFKYRFPVMAFFSAFVAIFLDLGAFMTGCFLYATEYFKTK